MKIDHYETARGDELVDHLMLSYRPYRFTTLYSLELPGLQVGDVVQAQCQFEATNDLGFNVMLAHAMKVSREEALVSDSEDMPEGDFVSPCFPAGENITPGMHHGLRNLAASWTATWAGSAWLSVFVYAASTAASDGDTIQLERRYGGLSAVVMRQS